MTEAEEQMASPGGTLYTLAKSDGKHGFEGVFAAHGPDKGFHVKLRLSCQELQGPDANSRTGMHDLPGGCLTPRKVQGKPFSNREESARC
jgi:hypothetical protein